MGHRSLLVDLNAGLKVYLHSGATALFGATQFRELTSNLNMCVGDRPKMENSEDFLTPQGKRKNQKKYNFNRHAKGKLNIRDYNIKEYTDLDAVDDIGLNIEAVFVYKNQMVTRAYFRAYLGYGNLRGGELIYFKSNDTKSLMVNKRIKKRIEEYHNAYTVENIPKPKKKALSNGVKYPIPDHKIEEKTNIVCSSIAPLKRETMSVISYIDPSKDCKIPNQKEHNKSKLTNPDESNKQHKETVKKIGDDRYEVNGEYIVEITSGHCSCSVEDIWNRKKEKLCTHIESVEKKIREGKVDPPKIEKHIATKP